MTDRIYSYPSVYAIGHKAIAELFDGNVLVEEKVDGSQFSMQRTEGGELLCRSKGKQLVLDAPEKMFLKAIETAESLNLFPGWIYRCEFLQKPKHNTLAYERTPNKNLILFDVQTGMEEYMGYWSKATEADRIGIECVPLLYHGEISSFEQFQALLETDSVLGGTKIEGVVIKNYDRFTPDKKAMMGKYVSESFKEKHEKDWSVRNPSGKDFIALLIAEYKTDARWEKAIQHLRDAGVLEGSPRDIGALIKEVPADVLKECEDEIKDKLFKHYWPQVRRGITAGLPEWYKARLAESAFDE